MTRRVLCMLSAAAVLVMVAADARSQTAPQRLEILDVPYLPQSEALCGGAAAAMALRYWGATGVYAETFADLVDRGTGGIRGEDLLRGVQARGWDARSFRGDAAIVREQLAKRRPVVALIEDRPGRFHYVVVVAWTDGLVIVHDPARSPYRVLDAAAFERSWKASGFWTMLILPGETATVAKTVSVPVSPATAPCGAMVDEGVRLAGAGDTTSARRVFEVAAAACPQASGPWREMAGLHALLGNWREAATAARRAATLDRDDHHAWRTLATALYLQDDPEGALAAWNHVGEPRIDLVNVHGLSRTRHAVVMDALGLQPQSLLTEEGLWRARRRAGELPAAQIARVVYQPKENGQAHVDVTLVERPLLPATVPSLAAIGVRMLSNRELRMGLGAPTGGAELFEVSYRWWERRPRAALAFSSPTPFGGVWRLEAYDDRQVYGGAAAIVEEHRRGATLGIHHWVTATTRVRGTVGLDRWRGRGTAVSFGAGAERHLLRDTLAVAAHAGKWLGRPDSWTARVSAGWRSASTNEGDVWLARAGVNIAGRRSPLALWHGAGTGEPEGALLRAHPMLRDGVIDGAVFGRSLVHAGGEWRRWIQPRRRPLRFAPALFLDVARAARGAELSDTRLHADIGAGVRAAISGAGVVRIDVARGLRDGNMAVSVGWTK